VAVEEHLFHNENVMK
jgi:hypothetical protein